MDIKNLDLEIQNITVPDNYISELFNNNNISDNELSINLRLFLKHHTTFACENNLKELFFNNLTNYTNSWHVLSTFYVLMHDKIILLQTLNNWYSIYENKKFWALPIQEQIQFLINKKEYFLSIFDCSHGGIPFHYKLSGIFNDDRHDKYEVLNNVKYRLELILKLFGYKIFNYVNIPLITVSTFYESTNEYILLYLTNIFNRMTELLNQIMFFFNSYDTNTKAINNLFNPIIININTKQIDSDTDSDIDIFFN
jgi:hypothetical protein